MPSTSVPAVFSAPFMYWVGVDTDAAASDADIAEFNAFYAEVHVPEVLAANPGFVSATRYQLETDGPPAQPGPRWLAVYAIDDAAAAERYAAREQDPATPRPSYTRGTGLWTTISPRWRLMWSQVSAVGQPGTAPASIFMVGMDTPDGATASDYREFNDYYTGTHVPEVLLAGGYQAGTRLERYQSFLHRRPDGCPQFCAVYEGEGGGAAGPPPPAPTPGPPAWENRDTRWRLRYRRVGEQVVRPLADRSA